MTDRSIDYSFSWLQHKTNKMKMQTHTYSSYSRHASKQANIYSLLRKQTTAVLNERYYSHNNFRSCCYYCCCCCCLVANCIQEIKQQTSQIILYNYISKHEHTHIPLHSHTFKFSKHAICVYRSFLFLSIFVLFSLHKNKSKDLLVRVR